MLIPKLSKEELETASPDGKTVLHWAIEMAAVASVQQLVAAGVDRGAKDGKGNTAAEILDHAAASGVIDRLKKALVITEP